MFKLLGNIVVLQIVIDILGVDILCLWVVLIDYLGEIVVFQQIFQCSVDVYWWICNIMCFLLFNLNGFDLVMDLLLFQEMLVLDCWVVDCVLFLQCEIEEVYCEYCFWNVYFKVYNFCVQELGGFYLDIIKDCQYIIGVNSVVWCFCQIVLFYIVEVFVCWIVLILVFIVEEVWKFLFGECVELVMFVIWYDGFSELLVDVILNCQYWEQVMVVKVVVNKELENQCVVKVVGGNLQVEVILYVEDVLQV